MWIANMNIIVIQRCQLLIHRII